MSSIKPLRGSAGADLWKTLLTDLREAKLQLEGTLFRVNEILGRAEATELATPKSGKSRAGSMRKAKPAGMDLRAARGNISAARVAKLYGLSMSQLAGWLGRTKQAVGKTPEADSLQEALRPFERVARLRCITKGDAEFRKWLRTPHPDIDGKYPLELMARGQGRELADYVENILTGTPG